MKTEILKREDDIFRGLEGYKAAAQFGNTFKQVLEPYMPILQHYNIDPVQQVKGLMDAHYTLAKGTPEQRVQLFQRLAKDYGVDLMAVAAGEAAQPYVDPAVQSLTQRLQGVESQLTAAQQEARRAAEADANKQLDAFLADTATYPYATELLNDMAALWRAGAASNLKDAYEKALWANPVTRAKEQARMTAAEAKRKETERLNALKKSKAAQSGNVRTTAKSGSAAAPLGSMDDTIAETLAAIKSRG